MRNATMQLRPLKGLKRKQAPYRMLTVAVIAAIALLSLVTFRDYGISADEPGHAGYGKRALAYYLSGFADTRSFTFWNYHIYGAAFDGPAAVLNMFSPLGEYETRHLLGAAVGLAGLWGTWKLAFLLAGDAAGFYSVVFLALSPEYYGHMFNNPKDNPFAAGYVCALFCLLGIFRSLPRAGPKSYAWFALAAGLTCGIRVGGLLLVGYLFLSVAVGTVVYRNAREWLARQAGYAVASTAAIYAIMLVFWPWAQSVPFTRPLEVLRELSGFDFPVGFLFRGRTILATAVPADYLPTYLAIKLPEAVVVLAILATGLGLFRLIKEWRRMDRVKAGMWLLVAFAAVFPVAFIILRKSTVYNGMRHVLFIVPLLAVAAANGWTAVMDRLARVGRGWRTAATCLLVAYGIGHIGIMVRLHPYEYVYFNRFAGGLKGAVGSYETDYWGEAYSGAARQLAAMMGEDRKYTASLCGVYLSCMYYLPPEVGFTIKPRDADFLIASPGAGCDKGLGGKPVITIDRDGVPLAYILDLRKRRMH